MPHGHGIDNCSLRFCRNDRQLDLGESRSATQIFQRNLLPASHRLWAYVCAFGPELMVMMAKVMMVKVMMAMVMVSVKVSVMVSVMVVIVPEALKTSRLATSTLASKLPQTQSFPPAKRFPWKPLLLPKRSSLERSSQAWLNSRRLSSRLSSRLSCASGLSSGLSDTVYRYNNHAVKTGIGPSPAASRI